MKLADVELRKIKGRFYLIRTNKRNIPTQKLDISEQILGILVDNFNSVRFSYNGEQYVSVVHKLDDEQKAIIERSEKEKKEKAAEKFLAMEKVLANMYRPKPLFDMGPVRKKNIRRDDV